MQSNGFDQGVQMACAKNAAYDAAAYFFLRESLDFAVSQGKESSARSLGAGVARDVPGQRLAQAFAEFALQNFGPLASVVLKEWGVERSEDVGAMVYLLIDLGLFSRGGDDSLDDFSQQWVLADLEKAYLLQTANNQAQV